MADYKPENIIERIRQTIRTGKFGKDYTIIPRDKNLLLRETFIVDDEKIKTILLSLSVEDYVKSESSDNESFQNDIVHIFTKEVHLIRRYSAKIEAEKVNLYIKFTWSFSQNKTMIIISFHEENDI